MVELSDLVSEVLSPESWFLQELRIKKQPIVIEINLNFIAVGFCDAIKLG
jgi:hypothetical protein